MIASAAVAGSAVLCQLPRRGLRRHHPPCAGATSAASSPDHANIDVASRELPWRAARTGNEKLRWKINRRSTRRSTCAAARTLRGAAVPSCDRARLRLHRRPAWSRRRERKRGSLLPAQRTPQHTSRSLRLRPRHRSAEPTRPHSTAREFERRGSSSFAAQHGEQRWPRRRPPRRWRRSTRR